MSVIKVTKPHYDLQFGFKYRLSTFMIIYGIEGPKKIRVSYRIIRYVLVAFMHSIAFYTTFVCAYGYMKSNIYFEHLIGSVVSNILSLSTHYSMVSKRDLLKKVVSRYEKISALLGNEYISLRKVKNRIVMSGFLIWLLSATACSIFVQSHPVLKLFYSFFIRCDDYFFSIFVTLFGSLLIYAFVYGLPSVIGLICGIFYYELSEILLKFRLRFDKQNVTFNENKLLFEMKIHSELYKLSYLLQDAMSLTCFFLLCSQVTVLFCCLSMFVLIKTEDFMAGDIIELTVTIVLVPSTIIGILWCASRINAQQQKLQTAIQLLSDSYIRLCNRDANIMAYLNQMKEKQFPVMSAGGILELKPNLYLGLFGSLFTYGLLFLNLKR